MIRPSFEPLQNSYGASFLIRTFEEEAFSAPYHFHPEYELTFILKGEGKRYVGSNMTSYANDDLVLIGTNLPHCWKSENVIKETLNACSIVVQFTEDFLGDGFFNKAELTHIGQLLQRSSYGIQFKNSTINLIRNRLITLQQEVDAFKKLILFLEILQHLALSKEYVLLDQHVVNGDQSPVERERINGVLAYIVENFKNEITLDAVASVARMTPTAFCKYFKKITRKTFIETVTDYRINYAVQQLIQTDKPIAEVGFESGFTDVSHFYKTFKAKLKVSPLNYRKKFLA